MIKPFFILLFIFFTLEARDNPFFPVVGENDIPYTSNKNMTKPKLKRATLQLPSQARVIKKVTVEFQNLDGSLESKTIELDNSIDWHLPIFISQSYMHNQNSGKKNDISNKTDFKKLVSGKFVKFYASYKKLKIITKDKIIRDFMLTNPHRLVFDFKREASFKSQRFKPQNKIFKEIKIGNHSGYYRTVITLDGLYKYKMQKINNGYIVTLR